MGSWAGGADGLGGGGSGGGTLTGPLWNPTIPLAAPGALDADFSGPTVDPKWLTWDPAGIASHAQDDGMVLKTTYGAALDRCWGFHQAAPADNYFSVTAWVQVAFKMGGGKAWAGVFIGDEMVGIPAATAKHLGVGHNQDTTFAQVAHYWATYAAAGAAVRTVGSAGLSPMACKVIGDRVGNQLHFRISATGQEGTWVNLGTSVTLGANMDEVGIYLGTENAPGNARGRFENFQVAILAGVTEDDLQAPYGGLQTIS